MRKLIYNVRAAIGLAIMGAGGDLLRGITAEQRRTNALLEDLMRRNSTAPPQAKPMDVHLYPATRGPELGHRLRFEGEGGPY